MTKKVLITGGKGDIAQAIRKNLEAKSYEVATPGKDEMDVTSIDSVERYVAKFKPDILINNAGYVKPTPISDCDIESEKRSIDVNLFGTFNCTAAALRENPEAQIINIGSSAATKVHGTWSSYCASKAAVVMATECWADDGVNAVCISPGRAQTKMRSSLYQNEDPSTLLKPEDFAIIVANAVDGQYEPGSHINVNVNNVGELINA